MLPNSNSVWRYFDLWLLAAVLLLTTYGIVMIRSAITGAPEFENYDLRQLAFAALGLILLLIVAAIDYRILTSSHWFIYVAFLGSLAFILVAGTLGNAAQRWIVIAPGINFQPTELGRIFFAITFGAFLAQRQAQVPRGCKSPGPKRFAPIRRRSKQTCPGQTKHHKQNGPITQHLSR